MAATVIATKSATWENGHSHNKHKTHGIVPKLTAPTGSFYLSESVYQWMLHLAATSPLLPGIQSSTWTLSSPKTIGTSDGLHDLIPFVPAVILNNNNNNNNCSAYNWKTLTGYGSCVQPLPRPCWGTDGVRMPISSRGGVCRE